MEQFNSYHDCNITIKHFHALKSAVPSIWHKLIINGSADNAEQISPLYVFKSSQDSLENAVCISKLLCKTFYSKLTADAFLKVQQKQLNLKTPLFTEWGNDFGPIKWPLIFSFLYSNHIDRKLVDLIYRTLHFSVTTRVKLLNMGLDEHRLCTRCYAFPETLKHMFLECSHTLKVWDKALAYITRVFPAASSLNPNRIIIIGFADLSQCKSFLAALEDIRFAYFKATYFQRNRSLYQHILIDGVQVFLQTLKSLVQTRLDLASKSQNMDTFRQYSPISKHSGGKVALQFF